MLMTNDVALGQKDLGWLLEDFVARVPGVDGALLASRDGLKLAAVGLSENQADQTSAVVSGLYSLARGVGKIKGSSGGAVRQVLIEHDEVTFFVMSAGDGLPQGMPMQPGSDPRTVGSVLAVLAAPDADPGMVGYEMATLIKSVAEHLVTATRRGDARCDDGQ
jgi:predicted regulator of Ras-like GTPase activity (Roadblock/LC7/MglB family)